MTSDVESLFCVCMRRMSFIFSYEELAALLPSKMAGFTQKLQADISLLRSNLPTYSLLQLPPTCFAINSTTKELDVEKTILGVENHIATVDFFDLCARYGLDNPTERVYPLLRREQCEELLRKNAPSRCRILELSDRHSLLYYDEIALECAASGFLQPLERSLMKIAVLDDTLLPKCVLQAISNGHYKIANHIVCDNFEKGFYSLFPDGHVPADFFVRLLDPEGEPLSQGEQIAVALLKYLPTLDVQRLRRLIEDDASIKRSILMRFDTIYSEIIDFRNYPCDYD